MFKTNCGNTCLKVLCVRSISYYCTTRCLNQLKLLINLIQLLTCWAACWPLTPSSASAWRRPWLILTWSSTTTPQMRYVQTEPPFQAGLWIISLLLQHKAIGEITCKMPSCRRWKCWLPPGRTLTKGDRAFAVRAPKLWNSDWTQAN